MTSAFKFFNFLFFFFFFLFLVHFLILMSLASLFQPLPALNLSHRIVMAPLTRLRANQSNFAPTDLSVEYYKQRATPGGLLITEACPISPETPYDYAPGIYTTDQEEGWSRVVRAVHEKGGKISLQLWHLGRMSHACYGNHPFLRATGRPLGSVSSSAVAPLGSSRTYEGKKVENTPPRPLTLAELQTRLVNDYELAVQAAKRCNFDFVEIHAAHGYLFDQFLCDGVNKRTDEYGPQTFENRVRLLRSVIEVIVKIFGPERVGIRISPTYSDTFAYQNCSDQHPEQTYRQVVAWLNQFRLGYLLLSEPRWNGGRNNSDPATDETFSLPLRNGWVREVYNGHVIGCSSFTPLTAAKAIEDGVYDAICFGRFFISNPDLVYRIKTNTPLNVYDVDTFYSRGPHGYIDYPDVQNTIPNAIKCKQISFEEIGKSKQSKL
jgi:N-ethylmaleimide reductase